MQHLRNRRHQLVASVALLAILTAACGDIPTATPSSPTTTTTKPAPMRTTTTTVDPNVTTVNMARILDAEAATQTAAHKSETVGVRVPTPLTGAPAVSGSLAGVVACIKAHESGNYTEQSHLHDGSGAYQMIPGTFRAWQARWATATGYGGTTYAYAYQAPPWMQDAITVFALTNGGAGNWSMRWGNDPCTAGLPGGG